MTNGQTIGKTMSNGEKDSMPLPGLGKHTFEVSKEGYMFQSVSYEQEEGEASIDRRSRPLRWTKLRRGRVDLNAIRFQYGSATLESTYQGDWNALCMVVGEPRA